MAGKSVRSFAMLLQVPIEHELWETKQAISFPGFVKFVVSGLFLYIQF